MNGQTQDMVKRFDMGDGTIVTAVLKTTNYPDINPMLLQEVTGILGPWAIESLYRWIKDGTEMKQSMQDLYGFGELFEMTNGKVGEDGIYRYPEDPDLKPVVEVGIGEDVDKLEKVFHIYEYAIIAIPRTEGGYFVTRMD